MRALKFTTPVSLYPSSLALSQLACSVTESVSNYEVVNPQAAVFHSLLISPGQNLSITADCYLLTGAPVTVSVGLRAQNMPVSCHGDMLRGWVGTRVIMHVWSGMKLCCYKMEAVLNMALGKLYRHLNRLLICVVCF